MPPYVAEFSRYGHTGMTKTSDIPEPFDRSANNPDKYRDSHSK